MSTSNGRDPYFELLNMVRGEAAGQIPLYFCLGQVLKATEEELVVLADGHELDQEDILVADWLKPAWEEKAEILLQEVRPAQRRRLPLPQRQPQLFHGEQHRGRQDRGQEGQVQAGGAPAEGERHRAADPGPGPADLLSDHKGGELDGWRCSR